MPFTLESPAFQHGQAIPWRYTGDGDDVSPPLWWSGVPEGTRSLVPIVDGVDLPAGTLEGLNDWKRLGYGGPCPPIGRHRYGFTLRALDRVLPDLGKPTKRVLENAMPGHRLGEAEPVGVFRRRG